MKNSTKVVLICLICLTYFIILNQRNEDASFNKDGLPSNWSKDTKEVVRVYINAINTKDLELMNECIFNMESYDYNYLGFSGY